LALQSPGSERGLTLSSYFKGPLYERMRKDLHLGGMSGKGLGLEANKLSAGRGFGRLVGDTSQGIKHRLSIGKAIG